MLIYCRAPLPPDSCLFDKYRGKKTSDYDVPHATSVSDDWVYPCCRLFELERWNVHHHGCADFIWPFRQQLLESETAFCGICTQELHFCSGFHFTSGMSTFMSSTIYLSGLSFYLCYPILFTNAHHWISWRSDLSSAISLLQL